MNMAERKYGSAKRKKRKQKRSENEIPTGVQIAVGDAFNDLGRDLLQFGTMATRGIANWVNENKSLVSGAGMAVIALGG